MSTGRIHQLHAELEELTAPAAQGLHSLFETISGAAGSISGKIRPVLRPVQKRSNLATLSGLMLAGASVLGWILSSRRGGHETPQPPPADPAQQQPGRGIRHRAAVQTAPGERRPTTATPPGEITDVTRNFLLGAVLPIWQVAGIADWICHRRAGIEHNAGTRESLIHLLMLGEAMVPVIAGMTLEITSPILLVMFAAVVVRSLTGLWDVTYAVKHRKITPIEQHVHSYLEMVPVMATAFITVLHWPELRALLGFGHRKPDWSIRRKARPLPLWAVGALLSSMFLFEVLPYLEELRRTRRHK